MGEGTIEADVVFEGLGLQGVFKAESSAFSIIFWLGFRFLDDRVTELEAGLLLCVLLVLIAALFAKLWQMETFEIREASLEPSEYSNIYIPSLRSLLIASTTKVPTPC